jgi:hypothetical protein
MLPKSDIYAPKKRGMQNAAQATTTTGNGEAGQGARK